MEASALRMPKFPPHSASVKPLYQWLSSPVVTCPRLSIWVATLSLMKRAQLCQASSAGLTEAPVKSRSCWRLTPSGVRKEMISPGEWPGHL